MGACVRREQRAENRRLLYARSILKRQAITLAFHAGIVDKNSAVSSETSEGNGEMRIKLANFANGVWLNIRGFK